MPYGQGEHNHKCYEQKSSFITNYHSLRVTVEVSERADRGNHKVGGKPMDSVKHFG